MFRFQMFPERDIKFLTDVDRITSPPEKEHQTAVDHGGCPTGGEHPAAVPGASDLRSPSAALLLVL